MRINLIASYLVLKFPKIFKTLGKCSENGVKQFRKKASRKLKLVNEIFETLKKLHHMGLSMQRKLSAY